MSIHSRKENSVRNAMYGLFVTFLNVIVSFVNRTFLVKYLGVELLGINGLFTEVIAMMSLAELGVGMAIIYSLYKPIHVNDYKKINQLMSMFRSTYNLIALVIFALGVAALPFIQLIVNGTDVSVGYIRFVFFLFVINSASSYLFSYNTSFINANQKQYVVSLATTVGKVLFTGINILLLYLFESYILYLSLLIVQTLCTNVYLAIYVKKKYPFITYDDKLPSGEMKSIFQDIKHIFIKRVSGVLTSSSTNILISLFVNTVQVGLYSNYVMIFSFVRTLKTQFSNAVKAGIGDLSVSEEHAKCISVLRQLTFMFFMFAIVVCTCLLYAVSDFIYLWIGPEYIMATQVIAVAIFNLFLELFSEPLWQYLEVSGLFKQDKYIAIIGSTLNLLTALILGHFIGIIGIFLGTIVSQIVQMFLKTRLLFKYKYEQSCLGFLFMQLKMLLAFVVCSMIMFFLSKALIFDNIYVGIILKIFIAFVISILVGICMFVGSQEERDSIKFVRNLL